MLTLYGRASSSNVQAVSWGLRELAVDYNRIDCGEGFGSLDTPEFRAMNPHGRIPVLVDKDAPAIFESSAILRYVSDVYGTGPFWPKDPVARSQVDKWAEWAKVEVADKFTGPIFWRVVRTPVARHDHQAIKQAVQTFEAELTVAEMQLHRTKYLAGDDFTLADIVFGHTLYRYFTIDITRQVFPNLDAYYRRLITREPYQETVMVSYEALRDTI